MMLLCGLVLLQVEQGRGRFNDYADAPRVEADAAHHLEETFMSALASSAGCKSL